MARPTKEDLELAVARYVGIQRSLVIPNLSHSFFVHECDVVAVSAAGYMTEYEIKTSVGDLRREWSKDRWKLFRYYRDHPPVHRYGTRDGFSTLVRRYVIVVPDAIGDKCLPLIPEDVGAGLITFAERSGRPDAGLFVKRELAKPRVNTAARKVTPDERAHLGHLMALRYWGARRRSAGLGYF